MDKHIKAPFDRDEVKKLKAGDYVYIDGIVYSARDAAHKRMYDSIMESGCYDASGTELYEKGIVPIDLNGNVIYYRTDTGKTGTDYRISRAYYQQPYGQIHTAYTQQRIVWNDRER